MRRRLITNCIWVVAILSTYLTKNKITMNIQTTLFETPKTAFNFTGC